MPLLPHSLRRWLDIVASCIQTSHLNPLTGGGGLIVGNQLGNSKAIAANHQQARVAKVTRDSTFRNKNGDRPRILVLGDTNKKSAASRIPDTAR